MIARLHYVLASSGEAAVRLASLIELGSIPPMAATPQGLLALAALHPGGYRPSLLPFLVYTGKSEPEFRRLGEKP